MGQVAECARFEDDAFLSKQLDPCFRRFGAVQDGCKRGHCPAPFTELPCAMMDGILLKRCMSGLRLDHVRLHELLDRIFRKENQAIEFDVAELSPGNKSTDAAFGPT